MIVHSHNLFDFSDYFHITILYIDSTHLEFLSRPSQKYIKKFFHVKNNAKNIMYLLGTILTRSMEITYQTLFVYLLNSGNRKGVRLCPVRHIFF